MVWLDIVGLHLCARNKMTYLRVAYGVRFVSQKMMMIVQCLLAKLSILDFTNKKKKPLINEESMGLW